MWPSVYISYVPQQDFHSTNMDSCIHELKATLQLIKDIELDPVLTGLKASPTQVKKIQTKGGKTAGKVFETDAREGARLIVEKLKEKFVI